MYPEYEGRGYASKLLDALADYARERGVKVVPYCTYAIRAFRKFPERYGDVDGSDKKRRPLGGRDSAGKGGLK